MVLSVVSPYRPLSTFLLAVGALGLYTPGPIRLDGVYCPSALFLCDDPAGRHLGRSGPTNPPHKEQCRETVRTVLRTGPGVQRPEALTTNQQLLSLGKSARLLSIRETSEQKVLSDRLLSLSLSNRPLSKVRGTSGRLV